MSDWFTLDLPKPPSVNRLVSKLGNKSPCVSLWRNQADRLLLAAGKYPRIKGAYELLVAYRIDDFGKFDPDNRLKPLCDWLQSREIIENDKLCRMLCATWGYAPEGVRVQIRPWGTA